MIDEELLDTVRTSLSAETRKLFDQRVAEQAQAMADDYEAGRLDNSAFATGMELEAYVVDQERRPRAVPEAVFDVEGCDGELGLHNLEIHTPPDTATASGIDRQARTLKERVDAVREALAETDSHLALDGMWATPPSGGTDAYFGATTEHEGIVVADNMATSSRYVALDNEVLRRAGGSIPIAVPGYSGSFPTILIESLATSIQPHIQIPDAETFPQYFNLAIRTAGPVLALSTNSPFLPADCYASEEALDAAALAMAGDASPVSTTHPDRIEDPEKIVEATYHELRVPIFEQSINVGLDQANQKVRFPQDLDETTDVVDRLVADETYAPFLTHQPDGEVPYDERYPELAHKRGTYWRWVRAVVGGDVPRGPNNSNEASIRIEYRPLPTQPTVRGTIGLQALVVGLLKGLATTDHPLTDLSHDAAQTCFYEVVRDGLEADLAWITADGDRPTDTDAVYTDLFEHARLGLAEFGVGEPRIEEFLAPLEARWRARTAPSDWRKERVLEELDDDADLQSAVRAGQQAYLDQVTAIDSFAELL